MAEPLVEELQLDISSALESISSLGAAFDEIAQGFAASLSAALADISAPVALQADTSELQGGIDAALAGTSEPIVITGDASELDTAIADAFDAPRPEIPVEADTAPADAAISALDIQPPVSLTVEADTSDADAAITAVEEGQPPIIIPVDADISALDADLSAATEPRAISITADVSDLPDEIAAAVETPTPPVPVDGDASGLDRAITDIFDAPRPDIPVDADTTPAETAIAGIADVPPLSLTVDADVSDAAAALLSVEDQPPIVVAVEADTAALDADLTAATEPRSVGITADTSDLTGAITDAIDAPLPPVLVDGDASGVDAAISDALDAPRPPVTVEADTDPALTALAAPSDQPPVSLTVDADTAAAQDALSALAATQSQVMLEVDADTGPALDATSGISPPPETVEVDADLSAAEAALADLTVQPISIETDADTTAAEAAIRALVDVQGVSIPVDADTADAERSISALANAEPIVIPVDGDTAALTSEITDSVQPQTVEVGGDTEGLSTAIGDAVNGGGPIIIPIDADTTAIEDAISAATAPPDPIPLSADATELENVLAAAEQPITVPVDADISAAEQSIASLDTGEVIIPVDADTSAAQQAISDLQGEDIVIPVGADTSGAETSLSSLGETATTTAGGGAGGGEGLAGVEGAILGIEAASSGAEGSVAGITGALKSAGGATAGVAVAGAAFTAFIGKAVSLAADAEAQQSRFDSAFAATADIVEHIDVGGLTIDLKDLAAQSGTTEADLQASAVRIGLIGQASKAAGDQVAGTTSDILGLAGALSVSNPRFGDAAQVADTLTKSFATGRTRPIQQYGIFISQAAVQTKALQIAQENGRSTATAFDKVQASLAIALEQQGNTLGTKFKTGAESAAIQMRALKVEFDEALVAIGKPLLSPVLEILKELVPVGISAGEVLGAIAQIVVPALAAVAPALTAVNGVLSLTTEGLTVLRIAIGGLSGAQLLLVAAAMLVMAVDTGIATAAMTALGVAIKLALGPIGLIIGALALLGAAYQFDIPLGNLGIFSDAIDEIRQKLGGTSSAAENVDAAFAAFAKTVIGLDVGTGKIDDLAGHVVNLKETVDAAVQAELRLKDFKGADEGLAGIGVTAAAVTDALLGPQAGVDALISRLHAAADAAPAGKDFDGFKEAETAVFELNAQMKVGVSQAITYAQSTGKITAEQAAQISGQDTLAKQLQLLNALTADSASKDQEAVKSKAELSGELEKTIAAFDPTAPAAFTAALQDLGLSEADATTLTNDLAAATQVQTDRWNESTPAAQAPFAAYEAGAISAAQLEGGLVAIGVSVPAAQAAVKATAGAIDQFVQSAVSKLPQVSDAIKGATDKGSADFNGFVALLQQRARDIAGFTDSLKLLVAQGFGELAATFAQAGPEAAAGLARQAASDRTKAAAAQAGLVIGQATVDANEAFIRSKLGLMQQTWIDASGVVVTGYRQVIPGITTATAQALDAAKGALTTDAPVKEAQGAAEATSGAYNQHLSLAERTHVEISGASGAIGDEQPTLEGKATAAGEGATGAYATGFDPAGATKTGLTDAQGAFDPQNAINLANAAIHAGRVIGVAFGNGLEQGIQSKVDSGELYSKGFDAGQAIKDGTNTALQSASPSKVGIQIGQKLNAGLSIGLSNTASITTSAAHVGAVVAEGVSKSLDAFVNTSLGAIPAVGGEIRSFSTAATHDLDTFRQSLIATQTATHALREDLAPGIAIGKVTTDLAAYNRAVNESTRVTQELDFFKNQLEFDIHRGAPSDQIAADMRHVQNATIAAGIATHALAVATHDLQHDLAAGVNVSQIVSDLDAIAKAQEKAKDAAADLRKAADPGAFIAGLKAQNVANQQFLIDLNKITAISPRVAEELAKLGPDSAGALASALAKSPADVAAAAAALKAGQAFSSAFESFLRSHFPGLAKDAVSAAVGAISDVAALQEIEQGLLGALGRSTLLSATGHAQTAKVSALRGGISQLEVVVDKQLSAAGVTAGRSVAAGAGPIVGSVTVELHVPGENAQEVRIPVPTRVRGTSVRQLKSDVIALVRAE